MKTAHAVSHVVFHLPLCQLLSAVIGPKPQRLVVPYEELSQFAVVHHYSRASEEMRQITHVEFPVVVVINDLVQANEVWVLELLHDRDLHEHILQLVLVLHATLLLSEVLTLLPQLELREDLDRLPEVFIFVKRYLRIAKIRQRPGRLVSLCRADP